MFASPTDPKRTGLTIKAHNDKRKAHTMTTAPVPAVQSTPSISRGDYRHWRTIVRANGWYALRWMPPKEKAVFERLKEQELDDLADRQHCLAYCRRQGIGVGYTHMVPTRKFNLLQEKRNAR